MLGVLLSDIINPSVKKRYVLFIQPTSIAGQFKAFDYLDSDSDDMGELISLSPNGLWSFTSHSAQLFGVLRSYDQVGFLPHSWIWYPDYFFISAVELKDTVGVLAGCALLPDGSSAVGYDFIRTLVVAVCALSYLLLHRLQLHF